MVDMRNSNILLADIKIILDKKIPDEEKIRQIEEMVEKYLDV